MVTFEDKEKMDIIFYYKLIIITSFLHYHEMFDCTYKYACIFNGLWLVVSNATE
jgi:hypothetical protein